MRLQETPRGLSPVPFLVLERDIDRVSDAFEDFLRKRGRGNVAKGFLGEFFKRASLPKYQEAGTYARSCAWALSVEVKGRATKRWRHLELGNGDSVIKFTPDDLATILYGLEGIDAPEKLPRPQRKRAGKKRFLAEG